MNVKVDQEACISCSMCPDLAPEVLRMNDNGKAESYSEVDDKNVEAVQEAIDTCPVDAIHWED